MKRVLIAAGGTGGHIYPGLAIAGCLKRRVPDAQIIFVGSHVGMEKNIVPQYGYPMEFVRAVGFEKGFSLKKFKAVKGIFDGARDAKVILKKHNPDLVIGTGGFTSAMLLREASRKGYPTLIHEQNAYPGRSNLMTGKTVDRVLLTFGEAAQYFPEGKTVVCGNPVRDAFKHIDKGAMRKKLGLAPGKKMLLVMGGSQGAAVINKAFLPVLKKYDGDDRIEVYQIAGPKKYDDVKKAWEENGVSLEGGNCHLLAYSDEMDVLMGASDLVIGRSGATSIVEILASGTPSIMIPIPYSVGDHQRFNAKAVKNAGAGLILEEKGLTGDRLFEAIDGLIWDDEGLRRMGQAALDHAKPDADERILDESMKIIR